MAKGLHISQLFDKSHVLNKCQSAEWAWTERFTYNYIINYQLSYVCFLYRLLSQPVILPYSRQVNGFCVNYQLPISHFTQSFYTVILHNSHFINILFHQHVNSLSDYLMNLSSHQFVIFPHNITSTCLFINTVFL